MADLSAGPALDREAAQRRCDAATERPWAIPTANVYRVIAPEAENHEPRVGLTPPYPWRVICDMGGRAIEPDDAANAEFIAHARTDFPAALALIGEQDKEIQRLREALERIVNEDWRDYPPGHCSRVAQKALDGDR